MESISRRAMLGGLAGSAVAASSIGVGVAHATPAPTAPGLFHGPSRLSRPDRVFLARGLDHGAWVRSGPQDGWDPSADLWRRSGFTTPTFYNPPLYDDHMMRRLHKNTWAVAKAPLGKGLQDLPPADQEWMSPPQLDNVDRMFTCCFGDEEAYSPALVSWLSTATRYLHEHHPHVLAHTNQWTGEFNDSQLKSYLSQVQPDLLTFDNYYFGYGRTYVDSGGSVTPLYDATGRYRRFANGGHDGTGREPIAFGQYTCGFRLQPDHAIDGKDPAYLRRVFVSESQQHIVANLTWAIGGKWLTLFRWEKDAATPPWESDGLFLNDPDGSPTPQFFRYVALNATMRAYSPYLTRLRTRAVAVAHGTVGTTGAPTPASSEIPAFTPSSDPGSGVVDIRAVNTGHTNHGKPGDVVFGSFRELPQMSAHEAWSVLPDKDHARAFMLVNGLTWPNDDVYSASSTSGGGHDTRQSVVVTVDPPRTGHRPAALYRVDHRSGRLREMRLRRADEGRYTFSISIPGGSSELFVWG